MSAFSTVTHVLKALGGSLDSQIRLARGSNGKGFVGHLAMLEIKNREAKLTRLVSEYRLTTEQIVKGAKELASLRNEIKPGKGPVGTRISTETDRLLMRIQGKCRSEQALKQLEIVLSHKARYARAVGELGSAHSRGDFGDGKAFRDAVCVVAMLDPKRADSFVQQERQERMEELVACARDPKNDAKTLERRVKDLGGLICDFEDMSMSYALELFWKRAALETRNVQERLKDAIFSVWRTEVYQPTRSRIQPNE